MKTIRIDPLAPLTAQLRAHEMASHLGKKAVLYRFHDAANVLLYVGVTVNPVMRWQQHKRKPWWALVASVSVEEHPFTNAALDAELLAIRTESPVFNLRSVPGTIPESLRNETGAITRGKGREGEGKGRGRAAARSFVVVSDFSCIASRPCLRRASCNAERTKR